MASCFGRYATAPGGCRHPNLQNSYIRAARLHCTPAVPMQVPRIDIQQLCELEFIIYCPQNPLNMHHLPCDAAGKASKFAGCFPAKTAESVLFHVSQWLPAPPSSSDDLEPLPGHLYQFCAPHGQHHVWLCCAYSYFASCFQFRTS